MRLRAEVGITGTKCRWELDSGPHVKLSRTRCHFPGVENGQVFPCESEPESFSYGASQGLAERHGGGKPPAGLHWPHALSWTPWGSPTEGSITELPEDLRHGAPQSCPRGSPHLGAGEQCSEGSPLSQRHRAQRPGRVVARMHIHCASQEGPTHGASWARRGARLQVAPGPGREHQQSEGTSAFHTGWWALRVGPQARRG